MITKEEFLNQIKKDILPNLNSKGYFLSLLKTKNRLTKTLLLGFGVILIISLLNPLNLNNYFIISLWILYCSIFYTFLKTIIKIKSFELSILPTVLSYFDFLEIPHYINETALKKSHLFSKTPNELSSIFKGKTKQSEFIMGEATTKSENILLISVPYSNTESQTIIYNCPEIFKSSVLGFEKIDTLFSHNWFDENVIFSKNKNLTTLLITPDFITKQEQIKKLFLPALGTSKIDISIFDKQMLLAIYTEKTTLNLIPHIYHDINQAEKDILIIFENLYDKIESIKQAVDILTN